MPNFFLSCDWGTSAFRLRLVRLADQQILEELISGEGVAMLFARWNQQGGPDAVSREAFGLQFLQNQLGELAKKTTEPLQDLPLVISGMASSSIGIRELPYAQLPFSLDGRDALVQQIEPGAQIKNQLLLISGVSTDTDVMRGEETQVIGLGNQGSVVAGKPVISIFPGTHSKHIQVQDGKITDFKTYMTGELFELLAGNSILKQAVAPGIQSPDPGDLEAFDQGISRAVGSNILHRLFSVRVNQLFSLYSREQNYLYLSGLLIGTELKDLLEKDPGSIQLCSGSNLYPWYQRGLEKLNLAKKTSFISPEMMDQSAVAGQIKIFQHHYGR